MQSATSTHNHISATVTQLYAPTSTPSQLIQSPKWDPEAIYQLVLGIAMIFLAIPGCAVALYFVRRRRLAGTSSTSTATAADGNMMEMMDQMETAAMTNIASGVNAATEVPMAQAGLEHHRVVRGSTRASAKSNLQLMELNSHKAQMATSLAGETEIQQAMETSDKGAEMIHLEDTASSTRRNTSDSLSPVLTEPELRSIGLVSNSG